MSAIEQDITSIIERLKIRQAELSGQYGVITRVIETLEKSLEDLTTLPTPIDTVREIENSVMEVQAAQSANPPTRREIPTGADPRLRQAATYFNLSQTQAVVMLMRIVKRPLGMLEILDILKSAEYPFKAKVPYQSLFSVMMRSDAFVKRGKLWGLREWSDTPASSSGGANGHLSVVRMPKTESGPISAKTEATDD